MNLELLQSLDTSASEPRAEFVDELQSKFVSSATGSVVSTNASLFSLKNILVAIAVSVSIATAAYVITSASSDTSRHESGPGSETSQSTDTASTDTQPIDEAQTEPEEINESAISQDTSTSQSNLVNSQPTTPTSSNNEASADTGVGDTVPDPVADIDTDWQLSFWNLVKFTEPPTMPAGPADYTTTVPELNFNWGVDSIDPVGVNTDFIVMRATKQKTLFMDIGYTIEYEADDGVRIYVNGDLIVDQWSGAATGTQDFSVNEDVEGATILVEYYEDMDESQIRVEITN